VWNFKLFDLKGFKRIWKRKYYEFIINILIFLIDKIIRLQISFYDKT